MGRDQDDLVLVPLRTFWRRIAGNQDIGLIQVAARAGAATEQVKRDLEAPLRERRRITPSEDDDFNVPDMQELVTALGGVVGIVVAGVAAMELATLPQVPCVFNTDIAVIALLFSAAVGVIFGYFPARKAARLDPIEALRYE
jgi:hypothetical protein